MNNGDVLPQAVVCEIGFGAKVTVVLFAKM